MSPHPSTVCLSRFKDEQQTAFPSSLWDSNTARQRFLKLTVQQIKDSVLFEGPDRSKNLALDAQGEFIQQQDAGCCGI